MTEDAAAQIHEQCVERLTSAHAAPDVDDESSHIARLSHATRTTTTEPVLTTIGYVPRSDLVRVLVVEDRPKEIVVAEEFGKAVDGVMTLVKRNVYITLKEPSVVAEAIVGSE